MITINIEKAKHQRKLAVDEKYALIYDNLDRAYGAAAQWGNPTEAIKNYRISIVAAHKAEKEAIDNE